MFQKQIFDGSEKCAALVTDLHVLLGLLRAAERLTMSQEPEDVIALRQVILAAKERAAKACRGAHEQG